MAGEQKPDMKKGNKVVPGTKAPGMKDGRYPEQDAAIKHKNKKKGK